MAAAVSIICMIGFMVVLIVINRKNLGVKTFGEFATANQAFGTLGITLAIFSTWYVGAMFTAWAGFAVGFGMIAFYVTPYAFFTIVTMYLCGPRTFVWAKKYSIATQGHLMGVRYQSDTVQVLVGVLGIAWTAPWLLMEWVTQGYIFSYASGGVLSPFWGMLAGVVVVLIYVSLGGMRSVITANILQGILMFVGGNLLMLFLVYKYFHGFGAGFDQVLAQYPEMLTYPGPGWAPKTPYWSSIVITSSMGAFMWPWVYNKLLAADSVRSIKKSALYAPILGMIFWIIFVYLGNFLHLHEIPREKPQEAFLWISAQSGIWELALMSTMIMAASIATVSAIVQAMSSAITKDMAEVFHKNITDKSAIRVARISVAVICGVALLLASMDIGLLIFVALLTYQGIIMLFPVVMLGLFWKRANKEGVIVGLIAGTVVSMYLTLANPAFIGGFGWTAGMYGAGICWLSVWLFGYLKPPTEHVERLWADIKESKEAAAARRSQLSGE